MANFQPVTGLVLGLVVLVSPVLPHMGGVVLAASSGEIAQIAKATTVRLLSSQSSGSGVLVAKQGRTYFVLTCRHIVDSTSDTYRIRTPDAQRHSVLTSQIRRFDSANLALLPFTSSSTYATATLADSNQLVEGYTIFVSGFPIPASNRDPNLDEFQFTNGIVSSLINPVRQEGYGFTHTSLTYTGMGGGPIFNSDGQLVGVHCGGDRNSNNLQVKTGFNWGIPINTFTKLAQQMGINLKTAVAGSPAPSDFGKFDRITPPPQVYSNPASPQHPNSNPSTSSPGPLW